MAQKSLDVSNIHLSHNLASALRGLSMIRVSHKGHQTLNDALTNHPSIKKKESLR